MKRSKGLFLLAAILLLTSAAHSQQTEAIPFFQGNVMPIYSSATLGALNLYIVGGATTSAASYGVFATTGISFTTTGGLYPGTTEFIFTESDANTLSNLVSTLNNLPVTTPGAEGGIVASFINGYYFDGETARLADSSGYVGCLGSANEQLLTATDTNGLSYVLSRDSLDAWQQYYITDLSVQATFASGTCFFNAYDGVTSTDTQIRHEQIKISALDAKIDIPSVGAFHGSEWNTSKRTGGNIRFDIVCSTKVSSAWINITAFKN